MKIKELSVPKPRVEMLPLIDSVFLILVFFIYAFLSMVVHRGLDVELPSASSAYVNQEDYVSVSVFEDGTFAFNKINCSSLKALDASLKAFLRSSSFQKDIPFFVAGDRNARHSDFVAVLDLLKASGVERVSIETKGGKGNERP